VVANQNLSRVAAVSPDVLATLLANVATLVSFRPGAADAAALAAQFQPLGAADLLSLPAFGCCWRLAAGAGERRLVTARTLPPAPPVRGPQEVTRLVGELRTRVPCRPLRLDPPGAGDAGEEW
ncbi:MAG: hypothetical protein ACYDB7_06660, partial [Mycobacteriales bacterium]